MRLKTVFLCIAGLIVVATGFLGQSPIPVCQTRALKTVEEARKQTITGSRDQALKLLKEADAECGTSYAVLTGIAQVYEQLGDPVTAGVYTRNAQLFSSQSQKPVATSSSGTRPGSPAPTSTSPAADKSFVREKYALVVGLSNFQSPKIPSLKFSAKDARDFAVLLADPQVGRFHKENITVLTDDQATTRAIRGALASIASKAMKDDIVLIYFSTHGSSPSMDQSKSGSGYLITNDTEVNELYGTGFGMDELATFIREKLRAERIVTFLDTCYSGDTTRNLIQANSKALLVLSDESIGRIAQGKGTVVITSSTSRELSWESEEKQNSFFTLYLMESLRTRNGLANIQQIYTDIQRTIPAAVRKYTLDRGLGEKGKGAEQNPVIYPINNIPDIIIGTPLK